MAWRRARIAHHDDAVPNTVTVCRRSPLRWPGTWLPRASTGPAHARRAARSDLFNDPAGGAPPCLPPRVSSAPSRATSSSRPACAARSPARTTRGRCSCGRASTVGEAASRCRPRASRGSSRSSPTGLRTTPTAFAVTDDAVFLRVSRLAQAFALHAGSTRAWRFVRHLPLEATDALRAGLLSQSPPGDGATARSTRSTSRSAWRTCDPGYSPPGDRARHFARWNVELVGPDGSVSRRARARAGSVQVVVAGVEALEHTADERIRTGVEERHRVTGPARHEQGAGTCRPRRLLSPPNSSARLRPPSSGTKFPASELGVAARPPRWGAGARGGRGSATGRSSPSSEANQAAERARSRPRRR